MSGVVRTLGLRPVRVVLLVIALLLAASACYWISVGHLGDLANITQILGFVVDVSFLLVPVAFQPRRPATTGELADAAKLLAEQVSAQWRTEIGWRGMYDPEPIRTEWIPVDTRGSGRASTTTVAPLVRLLGDGRRLVLTGEAGMGKTTLAAMLLLELCNRGDRGGNVPVLFRVSDWDPGVLRFDAWLARRLAEDYPALRASTFGADAASQLVNRRLILPILDGLDEAPEATRGQIVASLNRYLGPGEPLILTCRKKEYDSVDETLRDAEVYEAVPLTLVDVVHYLQHCVAGKGAGHWECLLKTPEATALRFVDSPFILWLIRTVYVDRKRDPASLVSQFLSSDDLLDHLLGSLVGAALAPEPPGVADRPSAPRHNWDVPKATAYLDFLAASLTAKGEHSFGWWSVAGLCGRVRLRLSQFTAVVILFTALHTIIAVPVLGLPYGLYWQSWLEDWWRIGVRVGFVNSVMVGIVLISSYEITAYRRSSFVRAGNGLSFAVRMGVGLGVTLMSYAVILLAFGMCCLAVGLGGSSGGAGYAVVGAILGFLASGPDAASGSVVRNFHRIIRVVVFAMLFLFLAWLATATLEGDYLAYSGWLTAGLLAAIITNSQHEPRYAAVRLRRWSGLGGRETLVAAGRALIPAALVFLSIMIPMTLYVAITYDSLDYGVLVARIVAVPFAIISWFVITVMTAAVAWSTIPWPSIELLRFRDSLRRDRRSAQVRLASTVIAVLVSLLVGIWVNHLSPATSGGGAFEVAENLFIYPQVGYVLPGISMLLVVAWMGSASAVFTVSTVGLALSRKLPARLIRFTEDCRRTGLLREVGPRYEFRHETFQRHLAAAGRSRPMTTKVAALPVADSDNR